MIEVKSKYFVLILWLVVCPLILLGQKSKRGKDPITYKYSFKIEGGRHKIGLPLWKIKEGPMYPYVLIGIEDDWRSKKFAQLTQAFELGFFNNKSAVTGYFMSLGVGVRLHVPFGTYLETKVGVGFLHSFRPRPVYAINHQGEYEKTRDWGEVRPSGDFTVALGQTLMKNKWDRPLSLYVSYRCLGQMFFNDRARLLPHTFGSLGFKMHFKE